MFFRNFQPPRLLRKRKSDNESIVNIPRFDFYGLAVKERLGQGSFGDVYTVDYEAPGKVGETVVVKKISYPTIKFAKWNHLLAFSSRRSE